VKSFTRKSILDGKELILLIDDHSKRVKNCTITCARSVCCHCGVDTVGSQAPFAFHGTRPRRFLVLVGTYVCKVAALLARWRCPHCHRTFTDYSSFARPHKAYTLPQMTERAAKYVSNTSTSYRTGVCWANLPIFYEEGPLDESVPPGRTDVVPSPVTMAHTSLFRWVTALAGDARQQSETLPADFTPASRKYTSEERRSVLIACRATCSVFLSDRAPTTALPC